MPHVRGLVSGAEPALLREHKPTPTRDRNPYKPVVLFEQGRTFAEQTPVYHVVQVHAKLGDGMEVPVVPSFDAMGVPALTGDLAVSQTDRLHIGHRPPRDQQLGGYIPAKGLQHAQAVSGHGAVLKGYLRTTGGAIHWMAHQRNLVSGHMFGFLS